MSSRSKKSPKEGEKHAARKRLTFEKPSGPLPMAQVSARHGGEMRSRSSRGFSFGEVKGSGIAMLTARRWGLPLDLRRRSVLDHNVEALRNWYAKSRQIENTSEMKKIERDLEKIGKEAEKAVKKGAAKAKKEAVKAEKEVEKVEKEIVEEVEETVKPRKTKKKPSESKPKGKPTKESK